MDRLLTGLLMLLLTPQAVLSQTAAAQPSTSQPTTRAGLIEQARREKAAHLTPEETDSAVNHLRTFSEPRALETFLVTGESQGNGFGPRLGGIRSGQGLAVGFGYKYVDLFDGRVELNAQVSGSIRRAYQFRFDVEAPDLFGQGRFLNFRAQYENTPEMDFYGLGPDSRLEDASTFLMEDTRFDVTGGAQWGPVRAGGLFGYYLINIGPGRGAGVPSSDQVFAAAVTPGLDEQPRYFRGGPFIELDTRDVAARPRSGGFYRAGLEFFGDQTRGRNDFRILTLEGQHYFSYLNLSHTVVLAARAVFATPSAGESVPLYLKPSLGSSHDLRGFDRYRFRDDNALALTVEHRWSVFSGLDMAVFADAGKVGARREDINLKNLETSVGFGFRALVRSGVFMRWDFGFSHEGWRLNWSFNDVF